MQLHLLTCRLAAANAATPSLQLDAQLGASLEDHWGLDTLVRVGETWLPRMLAAGTGQPALPRSNPQRASQASAAGSSASGGAGVGTPAAADVPLLKLFEFLTASLCLYVIEERVSGGRKSGVWAVDEAAVGCNVGGRCKGASEGGLNRAVALTDDTLTEIWIPSPCNARLASALTPCLPRSPPRFASMPRWWTIQASVPDPDPLVAPLMQRTLHILLTSLRLRIPTAWKSVQLSVVMLWNAAVQSGEPLYRGVGMARAMLACRNGRCPRPQSRVDGGPLLLSGSLFSLAHPCCLSCSQRGTPPGGRGGGVSPARSRARPGVAPNAARYGRGPPAAPAGDTQVRGVNFRGRICCCNWSAHPSLP
jgi:hypothetical protein